MTACVCGNAKSPTSKLCKSCDAKACMNPDRAAAGCGMSIDNTTAARLFNYLVDLAADGAVCPSNHAIAADLDIAQSTVVDVLQRLRRQGYVDTRRIGNGRVVTICQSGKETAEPEPKKIGKLNIPREPSIDITKLVRVSRDPCPRCGVRMDVGCGHRPRIEAWAA